MLLLVLAEAANSDGVCWPKVETLAKWTGVSTRTVHRYLDALEDAGLVAREERGGRGTKYRVIPPDGTPDVTPVSYDSPDVTEGDNPDCQTRPDNSVTPDVTTVSDRTVLNTNEHSSSAFPVVKEGVSDQPKPDNLPRPVAAFLEELLPSASPAIVKGWTLTWQAMRAMQAEGSPVTAINVMLEYLSWCRNRSISPVASHPVEWLARKEREHQEALASAPRQDDDAEGEEWERKILRRPLRDWNPSIPGMD